MFVMDVINTCTRDHRGQTVQRRTHIPDKNGCGWGKVQEGGLAGECREKGVKEETRASWKLGSFG